MPIIYSVIVEDREQADGRRRLHERHTDAAGQAFDVHSTVDAGADADALLLSRVPKLNIELANQEVSDAIVSVMAGDDPTTIIFSEQTNLRGRRRVIKRMIRSGPEEVMAIATVLLAQSDATLTNLLGISGARLASIKTVLTKASSIQLDFEAVRDDADRQAIE